MRTKDLFGKGRKVFSCEVFPPKRGGEFEGVIRALKEIKTVDPDFVSITYGAGGEGARLTSDAASVAVDAFSLPAAAHLTCANNDLDGIDKELDILEKKGICNLLVLRGDLTSSSALSHFKYASELAAYVKKNKPFFNILGACYPEGHPEAASLEADIDNLKKKTDAGVEHLVTQLFFDNADYFSFMEKIRKRGIAVPVSAGIMPVMAAASIKRIVSMCGASLPKAVTKMCAVYEGDDLIKAGADYAVKQIEGLLKGGAEGIHLYSMNKGNLAVDILSRIKK